MTHVFKIYRNTPNASNRFIYRLKRNTVKGNKLEKKNASFEAFFV
ncbi:hypothetical protein THIOSC15_380011 [uncultured Thiomicrorhabdus sp.]